MLQLTWRAPLLLGSLAFCGARAGARPRAAGTLAAGQQVQGLRSPLCCPVPPLALRLWVALCVPGALAAGLLATA